MSSPLAPSSPKSPPRRAESLLDSKYPTGAYKNNAWQAVEQEFALNRFFIVQSFRKCAEQLFNTVEKNLTNKLDTQLNGNLPQVREKMIAPKGSEAFFKAIGFVRDKRDGEAVSYTYSKLDGGMFQKDKEEAIQCLKNAEDRVYQSAHNMVKLQAHPTLVGGSTTRSSALSKSAAPPFFQNKVLEAQLEVARAKQQSAGNHGHGGKALPVEIERLENALDAAKDEEQFYKDFRTALSFQQRKGSAMHYFFKSYLDTRVSFNRMVKQWDDSQRALDKADGELCQAVKSPVRMHRDVYELKSDKAKNMESHYCFQVGEFSKGLHAERVEVDDACEELERNLDGRQQSEGHGKATGEAEALRVLWHIDQVEARKQAGEDVHAEALALLKESKINRIISQRLVDLWKQLRDLHDSSDDVVVEVRTKRLAKWESSDPSTAESSQLEIDESLQRLAGNRRDASVIATDLVNLKFPKGADTLPLSALKTTRKNSKPSTAGKPRSPGVAARSLVQERAQRSAEEVREVKEAGKLADAEAMEARLVSKKVSVKEVETQRHASRATVAAFREKTLKDSQEIKREVREEAKLVTQQRESVQYKKEREIKARFMATQVKAEEQKKLEIERWEHMLVRSNARLDEKASLKREIHEVSIEHQMKVDEHAVLYKEIRVAEQGMAKDVEKAAFETRAQVAERVKAERLARQKAEAAEMVDLQERYKKRQAEILAEGEKKRQAEIFRLKESDQDAARRLAKLDEKKAKERGLKNQWTVQVDQERASNLEKIATAASPTSPTSAVPGQRNFGGVKKDDDPTSPHSPLRKQEMERRDRAQAVFESENAVLLKRKEQYTAALQKARATVIAAETTLTKLPRPDELKGGEKKNYDSALLHFNNGTEAVAQAKKEEQRMKNYLNATLLSMRLKTEEYNRKMSGEVSCFVKARGSPNVRKALAKVRTAYFTGTFRDQGFRKRVGALADLSGQSVYPNPGLTVKTTA